MFRGEPQESSLRPIKARSPSPRVGERELAAMRSANAGFERRYGMTPASPSSITTGWALELNRYAPDALVFSNLAGHPIHPSNLTRRVWHPALKRAAADLSARSGQAVELSYRWHDLRHTAVSRLVAAGCDVKLAQAVAGHANSAITLDRYSHLTDGRVTEAASRFDPALF